MKLVHQINLAFAIVLIFVLAVSAVIIHYVLLDHFMGTEQAQMQSIGSAMQAKLTESTGLDLSALSVSTFTAAAGTTTALSPAAIAAPLTSIEAIVTNPSGEVLSGVMPSVTGVSATVLPLDVEGQAVKTQLASESLKNLWAGKDNRYLVAVNTIPQGTLTLISPVSRIREIEQELLKRLLLVICFGGVLMVLLSLLITRKLIRPLMSLKEELKKLKSRQYSEVQLIKAGGEIGSVAEAVYELARETERYSHAQKQFFQNASHELKTPLMSISGYAEGIRDGVFEGENIRKGLDIILGESRRLKNIVTEMTLLAKLDSEEDIFRPAVVSVEEILQESIERVNPLLVKKGLSLEVEFNQNEDESLAIRADQDKLLQAFLNVVMNAARYAKTRIHIHAGISNECVEITISDDGTGIPEDVLPYLFHRFVKGKDGDTGLGLAISRAIVERCGGRISAKNDKHGGAIFTFRFPVSAESLFLV
ncbi:sensor histidine kinase [Paenibacillus sp. sgz500958]|uniref:sensor histidine kinase n=1 Tax=Paenibacillus sp. sgz500958 TaxID=3242475 RepID=UPI0036D29A8A